MKRKKKIDRTEYASEASERSPSRGGEALYEERSEYVRE